LESEEFESEEFDAVQAFQSHHAGQHEQASDRSDVVRIEIRKEVRAKGKEENRQHQPNKAPFADRDKKGRERQVKRSENEETIEPDSE
jgi:hypothetical protein